jgi:UDP-N-acetylmuramate dehydrogenase
MDIRSNVSLKHFNTFGIDATAKYFCEVNSVDSLIVLLLSEAAQSEPKLVLGGGSNILFTKDYDGLVIKNNIKGITIIDQQDNNLFVKAGAGEIWHNLVLWSIEQNLGGLENLSLIPGRAGAAPIQNIGAYGVELKDVFHQLEAIEIDSGKQKIFHLDECNFGYRDSVFKNQLKDKYIIVSVTLCLSKTHTLNTSYGAIENELKKKNITEPTIKNVSDAVIHIRQSKLPDPAIIGNAGSFFKNPEVSKEKFLKLQHSNPNIAAYPLSSGNVKLAAGWLIEQCGWKGKTAGNTGSHKDQSLVLVNYGNATGKEIFEFARAIQQSVKEKFDVEIEREVNVI